MSQSQLINNFLGQQLTDLFDGPVQFYNHSNAVQWNQQQLQGQQRLLAQQQAAYWSNQSTIALRVREVWDVMAWQCTNCKRDLEIAKKGKMDYLNKKTGMVILECNHCGFEFMTKALTDDDRIKPVSESNIKNKLDLAVLRKKVKSFNLS